MAVCSIDKHAIRRVCRVAGASSAVSLLLLGMAPQARGQDALPSWMRPNPGLNMQDPRESQLMQPLVVSLPGMERVKVRENLVYTQADDSLVRMDVYEPLNTPRGERRPAVLYVHGGT